MNQFTKGLAILFIALTSLQSCDVEKFIDTNIKEKSLVVIAPDFIQNRVIIVFEDAETGAVIDQDLEVNIASSKRIIDLAGNYKTSFKAKRGLLNFAVDPNDKVAINMPLLFTVNTDGFEFNPVVYEVTNEEFTQIIRIPLKPFNFGGLTNTENKKALKSETAPFYFLINGLSLNEYNTANFEKQDDYLYDMFYDDWNFPYIQVFPLKFYLKNISSGVTLTNSATLQLRAADNVVWNNLKSYDWFIFYNRNDRNLRAKITNTGLVTVTDITPVPPNATSVINIPNKQQLVNYNNTIAIPKGAELMMIHLQYKLTDLNQKCTEGFNFNFEGLAKEDRPNLLYKTVRNEGLNSYIGYAQPTIEKPNHNTTAIVGNHIYGKNANKVVFDKNDQYIIEPQEMELGGEDSCGKTYNFKVYPRDGHNRYTLNLQFQCAGEEFSTAPSLVAFMTEEGSSTSESLIQFENGSTNLVLKPEGKYLVQGSFNETEFGFTFTANESQIEQAIAKTIAENNNIKDIEYTISKINNVESVINAKIIFKEGACPE